MSQKNTLSDEEANPKIQPRRSIKNIIVDSGMQSRLGLNFVALNFCVSGVGIVFILRQVGTVRQAIENVPGLVLDGHEDLANALIGFVSSCFFLIIASIFINFLFGLYMAHRFAGPMKVINSFIDELIAGRYRERRVLRPNDELKPIMEKLTTLAGQLDKGEK